jgi:hypothetical protein
MKVNMAFKSRNHQRYVWVREGGVARTNLEEGVVATHPLPEGTGRKGREAAIVPTGPANQCRRSIGLGNHGIIRTATKPTITGQ